MPHQLAKVVKSTINWWIHYTRKRPWASSVGNRGIIIHPIVSEIKWEVRERALMMNLNTKVRSTLLNRNAHEWMDDELFLNHHQAQLSTPINGMVWSINICVGWWMRFFFLFFFFWCYKSLHLHQSYIEFFLGFWYISSWFTLNFPHTHSK
jgi:hypothetical protein